MPLSHPEVECNSLTASVQTQNTKLLDSLQRCKIWGFFRLDPKQHHLLGKVKKKRELSVLGQLKSIMQPWAKSNRCQALDDILMVSSSFGGFCCC